MKKLVLGYICPVRSRVHPALPKFQSRSPCRERRRYTRRRSKQRAPSTYVLRYGFHSSRPCAPICSSLRHCLGPGPVLGRPGATVPAVGIQTGRQGRTYVFMYTNTRYLNSNTYMHASCGQKTELCLCSTESRVADTRLL